MKRITTFISLVSFSFLSLFVFVSPTQAACSQPTPTTASEYEQLLRNPIGDKWYHGDSGQSVALPNGKTLWVFGDTYIGTASATQGYHMINNSAILTDAGCATQLTGALNNQGKEASWVLPTTQTETPGVDDYYWSSTPYMDGSTLFVFLLHMYNDANGFHPIGADIASFDVSGEQPQLTNVSQTPGSANYENGPLWGAAVLQESDYTYIFGSWNKHEVWVFGSYYYLARVPNGEVLDQSAWRYWDGSGWNTDQAQIQPIVNGSAGLGTDVTVYEKFNGEYAMISKKYDAFGTDLYAWEAANLTGPWTEVTPELIAPIPAPGYTSQEVTYLGLGHPESPLASGKLLVTWSLNSNDISFFGDSRYGIYFAEVDQLDEPTPTPTPTPTNTPTPTATPTPSNTPTPTPTSINMIGNNSFESNLTGWSTYIQWPAVGTIGTTTSTKTDGAKSAVINVTTTSYNQWYVQLAKKNLALTSGKTYTVSFWAKGSGNFAIDADVQQQGGSWTVYSHNTLNLTTTWKKYTFSFQAPSSVTSQLAFNFAKNAGTTWIDNVSMIQQ